MGPGGDAPRSPRACHPIAAGPGLSRAITLIESTRLDHQALAQAVEHSRDGSRAPLLWSDAPFAGFSTVAPWMPVCEDYPLINAERQRQAPTSLWRQYQALIALRAATPALCEGASSELGVTESCVWFTRETVQESVWVAINFGAPVRNPWWDIPAGVLYGIDGQWLDKNQIVMKRSVHEQTQR